MFFSCSIYLFYVFLSLYFVLCVFFLVCGLLCRLVINYFEENIICQTKNCIFTCKCFVSPLVVHRSKITSHNGIRAI
jgi:hypothetical protein